MKSIPGTKRIYFRFLLQFIAFLLLPVVFASSLYIYSIQLAEQSCIDASLIALRQVRTAFDTYVNALDQISTQLMFEPQLNKMVNIRRPDYGSKQVYEIQQFTETLKSKMTASSRIDTNFVLLLKDVSAAYYNEYVIFGLDFFYQKVLNYTQMDYQEWYDTIFHQKSSFFIPLQPVTYNGLKISALTYAFPISPGYSTNKVALFLIDQEKIDAFCSSLNPLNYNIYITGSTGQLLYQVKNFETDYRLSISSEIDNDNMEGFYFDAVKDTKYMIAYTKSKFKDVVFTALIPQSVAMEKVIYIQRMTWLMVFCYILIGGISAVSIARRNSKPFRELAGRLMPFLQKLDKPYEAAQTNELDYIKTGVDYLIAYSGNMEDAVQQKYDELRDIFLDRLFNGSYNNREDIVQEGNKLKLNLTGSSYCVAIIEIISMVGDAPEQKLQEIYESIFPLLSGNAHSARLSKSRIGLLFIEDHINHLNAEQMMKLLYQMKSIIRLKMEYDIVVGVGQPVSNLTDIQFSFEQALFVLKNIGRSTPEVYRYEDMHDSSLENVFYYPIEMEHKLFNFTKAGDSENVMSLMDLIHEENIVKRKLTRRVSTMLMANLQSTLLKICSDTVVAPEYAQEIRRLNVNMPQGVVLNELRRIFLELSDLFAEKKRGQKAMMGDQAVRFIQEHYCDPMMGVPMVAAQFDFSESYFSQLFKEHTGQNFSVFLEQFRIEKAKALIRENKVDIEQIAQMVGYNNSNTFRRAFKRVEGISPSAYREATFSKNDKAI